jgi:thiamine biosynthesis lipoprotein
MGSTFEILFPSSERSRIESAHRALDEIRRLERIMTIFRDDSDLMRVNREAATRPVKVEPELLDVLQLSLDVSEKTGGAFDITSGVLSRCWGFDQRKGRIPSEETIRRCLDRMGSRFLSLDRERGTVEFERDGLSLNLGSIGKGFALDHVAEMLQNADFGKVLIHAGHSSMTAIGDASYPGGGWLVSLRDPVRKKRNLANLRLRNQALGTSGKGEQSFRKDGQCYGHVIDPRTGRPAEQNLSASCVAPSAALADALATAFFVMSLDSIERYCRETDDVGAVIVPGPKQSDSAEPVFLGIASACLDDQEPNGGVF